MDDLPFRSRRSALVTCHAAVSCDQPLAAEAGLGVLRAGGNAADAAVAMAAALNVTQPNSNGLGGDVFCLFYDAKKKKVFGLNGSGRAPAALTLDKVRADGIGPDETFPQTHGHAVTVPGAAAAWLDLIDKFGSKKVPLASILKPAIDMAEKGFPVTEICSYWWKKGEHLLKTAKNIHGNALLINGQAPEYGQVFRNPLLANTLKEIVAKRKKGFYQGRIADAIACSVHHHGGVMTTADLAAHVTTFEDPLSIEYKGIRLWEIAPNGHGIIALMTLSLLEYFDLQEMGHNSLDYIHTVAEALKLAFVDGAKYVADPSQVKVPIEKMLSKDRAKYRSKLINPKSAQKMPEADTLNQPYGKDTTYFTVMDEEGNTCSFICSNYMGFGSGIVPEGCGFTLQNRGSSFSLDEHHLNVVAPNKRPYHTIIPAMVTCAKTGELLSSYGVMGGFMQPQGHVQVLLNMLEFGMNPQTALDQPRFCIGQGPRITNDIAVEEGIPDEVIEELSNRGHVTSKTTGHGRSLFGRGHVITNGAWWSKDKLHYKEKDKKVLWTGTDPRCDGLAGGY